MNASSNVKIALVYDRVNTPYGGAEQVLLQLHELYPDAPLFTSVYTPESAPWASVFTVKTSFIQHIPFLRSHHRLIPWLMPLAYEQLQLDSFDIVISISSAEAKGVITKPHQLHLCYLLTPTRYLYSHAADYLASIPWILRPFAKVFRNYLRWWDQVAINRPDVLIPISELISSRIHTFHKEASTRLTQTIYPPIKIKSILTRQKKAALSKEKSQIPEPFLLCFGRLVSYKKFDEVIRAVADTNQKVLIVGEGPQKKYLQNLSQSLHAQCAFMGHVSDDKLFELISTAKGVLFPATEDFGISQIEVAATGTPVILHQQSGAAEILKNMPHVLLLQESNAKMIQKALLMLDDLPHSATMNTESLIKYDVLSFKDNIKKRVEIEYNRYRKGHYEHT